MPPAAAMPSKASTGPAPMSLPPHLAAVAALYREPDWLLAHRRQSLAVYGQTPLPDRVTHLWRYTDPAVFAVGDASPIPVPPASGTPREFPDVLAAGLRSEALAAAVYVRDGLVWKIALDQSLVDRGVLVQDLHAAAIEHPDLVQEHLGSLVGPDFGRLEAFANALWTGGLLIYVPRGVEIDRPMHIVTAQPVGGSARAGRLLVIVEEQASLILIDEYGEGTNGSGESVFTNMLVELAVGPAARLKYAPIQNWNQQTVSHLTQRARLDADAQLETVLTAIGASVSKVDCGALLAGPGAESNIFGLAIADGSQHYDHHTVHHHLAGKTRSDLHFKVALRERAESVYTGLIRIEDKAAYCEAYQENRNLILSPQAKAETIPELEILNNEVRCTHGATVGKIDPQEIFYLESRGLDSTEAVRLIVAGFVGPIIDHLPSTAQDRLRDVIVRRLEGR
ncbi:MAG: Fe-S cluster assembly protein SufD [Candidatus Zixiibacteriota bacterium]